MLDGHYFAIFTSDVGKISKDIQRSKHHEELKPVRLYLFWGTMSRVMVTLKESIVTQDSWVYDEVTKVIPLDCIVTMPNVLQEKMELPKGPSRYRILEPSPQPPYFIEIDASQYESNY